MIRTISNGSRGTLLLCLLIAQLFVSGALVAAVPNIPPAMLAQLQSMSPAEQKALARQYGIEIPNVTAGGGAENTLGEPGEETEVFERVEKMQLEQEIRLSIAEEAMGTGLKRFGHDLFDPEVSTFAPVDDTLAPDSYRLGPGDRVNIYMYGNEDSELTLTVTREGQLVLPRLGPVSVTGLSFEEVKELIQAKVASQLVGTEVIVSMGKMRAINVFLAGDVYAPGSYSVSGLSTALQVLFAGGGVTEIGSLRNIQIKRRGEVVGRLDTYDILLRGDTSGDVRLASGDTVFVPTVGALVSIDGEVKRPAIYEVLATDTLGDLMRMAGGLTATGFGQSASIQRRGLDQASLSRVQVNLTEPDDLMLALRDGDSLVVAPIKDEVSNQVLVRGAAARPGGYAWSPGMRVSDLLSSVDIDLLSETDLSTGLVVRRTGAGLEIEALSFSLGDAIGKRGSEADLMLQPRDEVLVFSLPYLDAEYQNIEASKSESDEMDLGNGDGAKQGTAKSSNGEEAYEDRTALIQEVVFRLQAQAKTPSSTQVVEISGDVRLPGKYPLVAGSDLKALVAMAGGFRNSAYIDTAEVTRIDFTPSGSARISTFKVPMRQELEEQSFELKPMDRIQISRIPNWSYGDSVTLTGSVAFPGDYPIVPGETLSSVLARAGGLTESGFPQGAVFIKDEAKKREREQIRRLIATIQRTSIAQSQTREAEDSLGNASASEDLQFLKDALENEAGGRVVIDLPAVLAGDPEADIQLESGDSLHIPEFNSTVSVIGEVRQPGTFLYEADRGVVDYLDLAAGTTVRADDKETYVVRANGQVDRVRVKPSLLSFTASGVSGLRPGDTIIVPVDEEYQPVLARYKEVSTVVFQSIASLYPLFRL